MEATLDTATYQEYLASLATSQRSRFTSNLEQLRKLSDEAERMEAFLPAFAKLVSELYAATSVVLWFRSIGAATAPQQMLRKKVSVGWTHLRLEGESEAAHQELVEHAFGQRQPLCVRPYTAVQAKRVCNPTDSFLLLAPIRYDRQSVAVLEIALGPKPLRSPHQELVSAYLQWLVWLGQLLREGISRCMEGVSPTLLTALQTVEHATLQAESLQEQIRKSIEHALRQLAGRNFGSLADNQLVAKQVHELLESKALRVQCPECGTAAILRCQKAGNSKTGAFMYDHYLSAGRTFHGGQTTFPEVTLVPKPARRSQKR